jgi:hypothetical protein
MYNDSFNQNMPEVPPMQIILGEFRSSKLSGGYARHPFEDDAHVFWMLESASVGNLFERQFRFSQ